MLYRTQDTSLQMDIYGEAIGGIINKGFMECNTSWHGAVLVLGKAPSLNVMRYDVLVRDD